MACEAPDPVRCLREFGEPIDRVGLETGTLTLYQTLGLVESGHDAVCMEVRRVNADLSVMRNETSMPD